MEAEKQKSVTTQIRMPAELHESIKAAAEAERISMNAEIVRRLASDLRGELREELDALRRLNTSRQAKISELEAAYLKAMVVAEEHKDIVLEMAHEMIDYFEKPERRPEDERRLMLELMKLLAEVQKKPIS